MRVLLLLLFALPAWGATHYVDPDAANGGSGSQSSPYNELSDITIGAGDTILVKANSILPAQTLTVTSTANVVVGIYGGTERALIDCNNAVNYGLDITQSDEFNFGDIDVRGCLVNNVLVGLSGSGTIDAYFSDMDASDITATQGSNYVTGNSFHAAGAAGAIGRLNVTYTDVTCSNVSGHCWDQRSEVFSTHYRSICNGAGIGRSYGAHCFTSSPRIQSWTNSWTLASGTTYYRARVTNVEQEYAMCGRGGSVGDFCAVQQAADDTTLSAGEWSKWANGVGGCASTNGCIAVNYGFDPNTSAGNFSEIKNARFPNGATYIGVEATGALSSAGGSVEGDGIVCDDLTANCVISSGTRSHHNDRNGIQLRQTVGARLRGFIADHNGGVGVLSQASIDSEAVNFVTHGNNLGFRVNTDYEKTMVVRNAVASLNTQNWVIDPQAVSGVTQSNNVSYAGTNANDNFTPALTSNPLYSGGSDPTTAEGFRPLATSPLIRAGVCFLSVGCAYPDFEGRAQTIPPTIGAFSGAGVDAPVERTTAPERTVRP